jgi:1,4-dihydroxy-2-naphthoyl-CoA hydrolase
VSPFDELIGTEWLETGPELARGRIALVAHHMQPANHMHGGLFTTLAESICSMATNLAVMDEGRVALGQGVEATLIRSLSGGHLNAVARRRHAGRTIWVWDCELTDDEDRLCALVRITIAVREQRPSEAAGASS